MGVVKAIVYIAALGVVYFVAGRLLPKRWIHYERFPFRAFAFENGGKIYEKLGIGKWKQKVPDMSRLFKKQMQPKRIIGRPDATELKLMIDETCVAELTHAILCLLAPPIIALCPGWRGIAICVVYILLGNLPFIMIQRYNRPRLIRLLEKSGRSRRS